MVNDQQLMMSNFQSAMAKLAVVGQNVDELIDCSEVIPIPRNLTSSQIPHFPAGKTNKDVEQAV